MFGSDNFFSGGRGWPLIPSGSSSDEAGMTVLGLGSYTQPSGFDAKDAGIWQTLVVVSLM
jgi:hypothetical protein